MQEESEDIKDSSKGKFSSPKLSTGEEAEAAVGIENIDQREQTAQEGIAATDEMLDRWIQGGYKEMHRAMDGEVVARSIEDLINTGREESINFDALDDNTKEALRRDALALARNLIFALRDEYRATLEQAQSRPEGT